MMSDSIKMEQNGRRKEWHLYFLLSFQFIFHLFKSYLLQIDGLVEKTITPLLHLSLFFLQSSSSLTFSFTSLLSRSSSSFSYSSTSLLSPLFLFLLLVHLSFTTTFTSSLTLLSPPPPPLFFHFLFYISSHSSLTSSSTCLPSLSLLLLSLLSHLPFHLSSFTFSFTIAASLFSHLCSPLLSPYFSHFLFNLS